MKTLIPLLAVLLVNQSVFAAGPTKYPSGLEITTITEGKGAQPGPNSEVTVHYRGTLTDGREFDSSYQRGQPATFPLNHVIKCWTEGVQKMKEGGKSKLTCPAAIAYGPNGIAGVIPPNATLIFEVDLIKVTK